MKTHLALVAAAVVLVSCSPIVKSVPLDSNTGYPDVKLQCEGANGSKEETKANSSGMLYFLPKSYLKIKVAPQENVGGNNTNTATNISGKNTKSKNKSVDKTGDQAPTQNTAPVTDSGQSAADGKTGASAPEHDIAIEFQREDFPGKKFTFTLDVVTKIDPQKPYYLQYTPSAASEDDIDIAVKDFFISSVKTTAENKSDEIALKSVELIKKAVLLGTGIPTAVPTGTPPATGEKSDKAPMAQSQPQPRSTTSLESLDIEIDPVDIFTMAPINYQFEKGQQYANNQPLGLPKEIQFNLERLGFTPGNAQPTCGKGVHYRAAFPYRLTIVVGNKSGAIKVVERIVLLPNESPVYLFDMRRSAFVKKTYDVKFENGFLTSAKINKPSELLAGISLPVDIIKSVASIPAEIIQLKINYNSQQQALLDAEKAKFDSLKAFNDAVLEMYKTNADQTQTLIEQLGK